MSQKPVGHLLVLHRPVRFTNDGNPALLGGGSDASPIELTTPGQHGVDIRAEQSATSGDNRLFYLRFIHTGAGGGGECIRAYCAVDAAMATAHGEHVTLAVKVGASLSGLGAGLRATLEAEAESRTLGGTLCALQVDSYIGTGNTMPASSAFIRFADIGAVDIPNMFSIAAGSTILAGSAANSASDALKVYIEGTGVRYIDLHDGVA